jgi:hypothetical protein
VSHTPILQCFIISFAILSCVNPDLPEKTLKNKSQSGDIYTREHKELTPLRTEKKNYVRGQILVKFKAGTGEQAIEAIQKELSLKTIRIVHAPNLYLMKILNGSSVERIMERLKDFPEVAFSEPNYIVTIQ